MLSPHVLGIDYGTDSVRAVLVNASTGEEVRSAVAFYSRWKEQRYCDPSKQLFRQHPLDYIEGLKSAIRSCLADISETIRKSIRAISIDTTGSTPVAVDRSGTPLSLLPGFEQNPNAMFVLWKDHTSIAEAEEINLANKKGDTDYLQFVGGIYSSEWYWAKLLHILRSDSDVRGACYGWVEHCDWIPFLLTGGSNADDIKRSVCAAGHKALFSEAFDGLPPASFWTCIDPLLLPFVERFPRKTYTADQPAGTISAEWAQRLGVPEDVVIGIGAFDAHMGAVGGQIEPYYLSKVMGTSTCDMLVAPGDDMRGKTIRGICGQVDGSIIPGMVGLEAGQSAFGDAYAWFRKLIGWPLEHLSGLNTDIDNRLLRELFDSMRDNLLTELSREAEGLTFDENSELAVDWLNGRRTPDANQALKAGLLGLDLASDAPKIFRAVVEATCFGARAIIECFREQGIPVKGLIGLGGVAKKAPFIMQMMADVTGMPIKIHRSEQSCAAGAAMFAATAAGIYTKVDEAMQAMGQGFEKTFEPNPQKHELYSSRYRAYQRFGAFIEQKPRTRVVNKYRHIQEEAYHANCQLPKLGLVILTFGNVSAADRSLGVFAIKPSGVDYDSLRPDDMVIVDFDGKTVEGKLRPSSDTLTHAVLYSRWSEIGGISHTHSCYATAWAQAQMDIPLFGTTHADSTRHAIPCAPPMGDKRIDGNYEYETGLQIIEEFERRGFDYRQTEMILVGNHAPFTWGKTADKAVYNSAVLEHIASMALLTRQIRPDAGIMKQSLINKHFERKHGPQAYYGQQKHD